MATATSSASISAAEPFETIEAYRRYPKQECLCLSKPTSPEAPAQAETHIIPTNGTEEEGHASGTPALNALSIPVRLRWGFEASDLRRVYQLHEDAFPLSYDTRYYEWLLDHDACIALVATTTEEAYRQWVNACNIPPEEAKQANTAAYTIEDWLPNYRTASTTAVAPGPPPPVPPPAADRPFTEDLLTERAAIKTMFADHEGVVERQRHLTAGGGTAKNDPDSTDGPSEGATLIVGFILGQCAFARHDAGHLLTNPTAYIGSFVVDPVFQRCGLGRQLLERFLTYMTQQRPLYAHDYLHYDERKLIALLVEEQMRKRRASTTEAVDASRHKKNDGDGVKSRADPAAAILSSSLPVAGSLLENLIATCIPAATAWFDDRKARQKMRAAGMSEEAIEEQRYRDKLSPDALTDEEAAEVRAQARHFFVQAGVHEVWLHCLPGNAAAIQLYAQRGFVLHRVLTGYYNIHGASYDALVLRYTPPSTTPAGKGEEGTTMDAVAQQHETARDAASTTDGSSTAASTNTVLPIAEAGGGLRRRRGHSPSIHGTATATTEEERGTEKEAINATASPTVPARCLQKVTWLMEKSYPFVADVVLCTPAEGQEEWQRRIGARSGDVTGRRTWWETTKELLLVGNAIALLMAVMWLAYNVVLTGEVM